MEFLEDSAELQTLHSLERLQSPKVVASTIGSKKPSKLQLSTNLSQAKNVAPPATEKNFQKPQNLRISPRVNLTSPKVNLTSLKVNVISPKVNVKYF